MRLSALSVRSFVLIPAFRFFGNGFPFPGSQSWPSFPYISPFLSSQCHIGFYLPWRHSIPPDEQTSYRAAASIRRNYWQHSTPAVLELFPTTQSAAAHSSAKGFPYVPNVSRVYDLNDVNSRSWRKCEGHTIFEWVSVANEGMTFTSTPGEYDGNVTSTTLICSKLVGQRIVEHVTSWHVKTLLIRCCKAFDIWLWTMNNFWRFVAQFVKYNMLYSKLYNKSAANRSGVRTWI